MGIRLRKETEDSVSDAATMIAGVAVIALAALAVAGIALAVAMVNRHA